MAADEFLWKPSQAFDGYEMLLGAPVCFDANVDALFDAPLPSRKDWSSYYVRSSVDAFRRVELRKIENDGD